MKSLFKKFALVCFLAVLACTGYFASVSLQHESTSFATQQSAVATAEAATNMAEATQNDDVQISVENIGSDSLFADNSYLNIIGIPSSTFTYTNNGGGTIDYAFDRNWNTDWLSGQDNNVGGFTNTITVSFKQTVSIESIVYQASNNGGRAGLGFPTSFKIYAAQNGGALQEVGTGSATATSGKIRIVFSKTITCDQLMFEYLKVNTAHKYYATAKEIIFCQPQTAELEAVVNLFTDYAKYNITSEYASIEKIAALRESVKNYVGYEDSLKPVLDRANEILNSQLIYDSRREFSTNPTAENVINQYGNVASYTQSTLQFYFSTTNMQVTGIAGLTGSTIKVYVEADENDPLPSISFTQLKGHWTSWKSTATLVRGENVLTFPNFINSSYSVDVVAGGAIYINNPYTSSQQSSNVKIYIEGGMLYPVFRSGDDETSYKLALSDYAEKVAQNPTEMIDLTDIVTDHTIMSVSAKKANATYSGSTISIQNNVDSWNTYVTNLLKFGGVQFDPTDPHYNEMNNHITLNIRDAQPMGGSAYAFSEHIGLIDDWSGPLLNFTVVGWGFSHELGHIFDISARAWVESTNNMWSMYDQTSMEKVYNGGRLNYDAILARLASDRDFEATDWEVAFDIWWEIVGAYPTFWGDLENLYRYESTGTSLEKMERVVYYSSLATKMDMTYYYERWGFFTYADASSEFKTLLSTAISDGRIDGTLQKKLWYMDEAQYKYMTTDGYGVLASLSEWGNLYGSASFVPQITEVTKSGNVYTIFIGEPTDYDKHLGYEILEYDGGKWTVIGFTHSLTFSDTYAYASGYTPRYKVVAYDRAFNASSQSAECSYTATAENVCRITSTYYTSLEAAVSAANDGDIIYITKNLRAANIVINKNITIKPDSGLTSATITKNSKGNMFTVSSGATLTMEGTASASLILDGYSFSQAGALITVNGSLVLSYVTLQNNINTSVGGAICVSGYGKIDISHCTFKNNSASSGGAIAINNASCRADIDSVEFVNNSASNGGAIDTCGTINKMLSCSFNSNTASSNGGAIRNRDGGVIYKMTNCQFTNNTASSLGGALCLDGYTEILGGSFSTNTATSGGAIYFCAANGARKLLLSDNECTFSNNTATRGGAIYIDGNNSNVTISAAIQIYNNSASLGSALCLMAGNTTINGNSKISGSIYLSNGKTYLTSRMLLCPSGQSSPVVQFANATDGMVVFYAADFTLTAADLSAFSYEVTSAYTSSLADDGSNVYLSIKQINVTVRLGSNEDNFVVSYGHKYTFADTEDSSLYYVVRWSDGSGNYYNIGDTVIIYQDSTFVAQTARRAKVTLNYGTSQEEVYVKPNTTYYLPTKVPNSNRNIIKWQSATASYLPAEGATIAADTTFEASYPQLLTLTYYLGGKEKYSQQLEYGTAVHLSYTNVPDGYRLGSLEIGGKKYASDAVYTITGDTAVAVNLIKTCIVTYKIGDNTITETADVGSAITIETKAEFGSRKIGYFLYNGNRYFVGDTLVVNGDTTLVAQYYSVCVWVITIGALSLALILALLIAAIVLDHKKDDDESVTNKKTKRGNAKTSKISKKAATSNSKPAASVAQNSASGNNSSQPKAATKNSTTPAALATSKGAAAAQSVAAAPTKSAAKASAATKKAESKNSNSTTKVSAPKVAATTATKPTAATKKASTTKSATTAKKATTTKSAVAAKQSTSATKSASTQAKPAAKSTAAAKSTSKQTKPAAKSAKNQAKPAAKK